jgi:hypothetical protein
VDAEILVLKREEATDLPVGRQVARIINTIAEAKGRGHGLHG